MSFCNKFKRRAKLSAISNIRNFFAIGQQHSTAFSAQQGAAAKTSMSRPSDGGVDEVTYAALNDADMDMDLRMLEDSLSYEAYKSMEDSKDER